MNNAHLFSSCWSGQVPFVASFALQQLRLWVSSNPWFAGYEHSGWFELPDEVIDRLQADYYQQWGQLGQQVLTQQPFSFNDLRFASDNWSEPMFGSLAAFYLLNSSFLLKLLDKLLIDEKKPRQRLRYLVEQAIAASAPSNFLVSNPDALQRVVETQGASLLTGMQHLTSDMNEGKMRQCDSDAFKVGVDLAVTPGEIVFENDIFQLIRYYPQSETQYQRPVFCRRLRGL